MSQKFDLLEDEILLINPLARGYYRVKYDTKMWKQISNNLNSNPSSFHRLTKSQLLDDAMNLAYAGQLDHYTAFKIFDYLRNETEYIPWASASSHLKFLKRMLQHDKKASKDLDAYGAQLSGKLLSTYGFDPRKGESVDSADARLIGLEWTCKIDGKCEQEAIERFSKMERKSFTLNNKYEQLLVCSRMRKATHDEYTSLMNDFRRTRNQNTRGLLIDAIACANNEAVIDDLLNEIKTADFESTEKLQVIKALYQNSLEGLNAVVELFYTSTDIVGEL